MSFAIVYEDSGVKRSAFKFILADLLTPESYEYIIGRFPRFIPFLTTWADLNISAIVSFSTCFGEMPDILDLSGFFLVPR